jgi:hypothetical protein
MPQVRASRFVGSEIKDPAVVMKGEINKRWEEWEMWKKNPGLKSREDAISRGDSKGNRSKSPEGIGASGSDYKGSTRSSRKGKEDLKFFRHFARNW